MQGFNMGRYVPPDQEGLRSGNQLAGKHALGSRGRKAGQGILTVRFEMPYAIWCTNCPSETIIGQGVRFNAEKKKVGNYFSSPIYSFRMKHTACGGWIEIRTDPKNTAYVVTEGARKRETGEDEVRDGDVVLRSDEDKERLRNDAFAALEVTIEGRQEDKINNDRINELLDSTDRAWDDPYAVNKRLRSTFRVGRKQREKDYEHSEAIKNKFGLELDLLPESDVDSKRAAYVDFGSVEDGLDDSVQRAGSKALFSAKSATLKQKIMDKKTQLRQTIGDNTRSSIDPFLHSTPLKASSITGIKRKREESEKVTTQTTMQAPSKSILVDYDSD